MNIEFQFLYQWATFNVQEREWAGGFSRTVHARKNNEPRIPDIREIKLDVTWSYVKRRTAKMKLLPSVFSSLNSRVKIFVFVANSGRHFSVFTVI